MSYDRSNPAVIRELTLIKTRVMSVLKEHTMLHLTEAGMTPDAVASMHMFAEPGHSSCRGITIAAHSESSDADKAVFKKFVDAMILHAGEGSSFGVAINDGGQGHNVTVAASDTEQLVAGISHALAPAYKLTLEEAKRRVPGLHVISSADPDYHEEVGRAMLQVFGPRNGPAPGSPEPLPEIPALPSPKALAEAVGRAFDSLPARGEPARAKTGSKLALIAQAMEDEYLARLMPDTTEHADFFKGVDFRQILKNILDFRPVEENGLLKVVISGGPVARDPLGPNSLKRYYTPAEEQFHFMAITPRRYARLANELSAGNGQFGTFSSPYHDDEGMFKVQARTLEDLARGVNNALSDEHKIDIDALLGRSPR